MGSMGSAALLVEGPLVEDGNPRTMPVPDKSVLPMPARLPAHPAWNICSKYLSISWLLSGHSWLEGWSRVLLFREAAALSLGETWAFRVTGQLQPAWGAGHRVMEC